MSYPQLLTPEEKLADAQDRLAIPKIVCICGSTRYMGLMVEANLQETADGNIVVAPGCNMKIPHPRWADPVEAEALKVCLDDLHRAKIRLANEVLVVGPYIGDSTRAEIAYARSLGKPVRFTHPEVDPDAECDAEPFTPPVHYKRSDGALCCVHTIPVGPDSCRNCWDLAEDDAVEARR